MDNAPDLKQAFDAANERSGPPKPPAEQRPIVTKQQLDQLTDRMARPRMAPALTPSGPAAAHLAATQQEETRRKIQATREALHRKRIERAFNDAAGVKTKAGVGR